MKRVPRIWVVGISILCLMLWTNCSKPASELKPYRLLHEPSTHVKDRVKMEVFVDFYCPHCHHFEALLLPALRSEFGNRLDVTEIGLPVIRNKPLLPFELYEVALAEGKGTAMAKVLFRTLQDEKLDIQDPAVESNVITEVGLDPDFVKQRLASGGPARALNDGIARAARDGVQGTPTILLDGYVLTENSSVENLSMLIHKLLAGETL